jgi:hypothetical protein
MAHNKRFATTLEQGVVPFLVSIEKFLAAAGIPAADYSSYTEIRRWFEAAVPIIRSGGHLWAPMAEAALTKLNELQDVLPIILQRMPPAFTLQWNALAERLEADNAKLREP